MTARLDAWLQPRAPAERLALLRMATGLFTLVYLVARAPALLDYSRMPRTAFAPVGIVKLLIGAPLRPWAVTAVGLLAMVASAAFLLGWRFRLSGPLAAALVTWVLSYRSCWGMLFHTENTLTLMLLVLSLSPSADALSLDARHHQGREPHARYGFPLRLLTLIVVTTYVLAGIAKLRLGGSGWLSGDTLRVLVAHDNLRKISAGGFYSPLAAPAVARDWLWAPLAWLTMVIELGAPVALLHTRVGAVWCVAAWCFHVGVIALMAILFPVQLVGLPYLAFFPLERVLAHPRLRAWRRGTGAIAA